MMKNLKNLNIDSIQEQIDIMDEIIMFEPNIRRVDKAIGYKSALVNVLALRIKEDEMQKM